MKRIIAFILILCTLSLIGCKAEGEPNDSESSGYVSSSDSSNETDEATTAEFSQEDLFKGLEFRWVSVDFGQTISPDRADNDIVSAAEAERDQMAKDTLGIKFADIKKSTPLELQIYLQSESRNTVSSFDMGSVPTNSNIDYLPASNYVGNVKKIPNLNLDREWYQQQANEEYDIFDGQYLVSGFYPKMSSAVPFYINETLIEETGLDLPYNDIVDGKWTIEKMKQYVSATYEIGQGEVYGFAGHYSELGHLFYGMGGVTELRDDNNGPIPIFTSDNIKRLFSIVSEFHNLDSTYFSDIIDINDETSSYSMFEKGRVLFKNWSTSIYDLNGEEEFRVGLGITPKENEAQENYRVLVRNYELKFFASNLEEPEKIGMLYDHLCQKTFETVYPAVIRKAIDDSNIESEKAYEIWMLADSSMHFDIFNNLHIKTGNTTPIIKNALFVQQNIKNNWTPDQGAAIYFSTIENGYSHLSYLISERLKNKTDALGAFS